MMHKSQTNVICTGQCFVDTTKKLDNYPYAVYTLYADNSIKLLAPKAEPDVKVKSTIYPPPNSEDVALVRFCTVLKQVIVYVRSGYLYFYRLEQGTSVMVKQIKPNELRDSDGMILD